MPRMVQKTAAILVLAFVAIPFTLACYCIFRSDLFEPSPGESRPPGLYALGEAWTPHFTGGPVLVWESRYRVGMSRDEIRKNFAYGARLIASDSRPDKDWRATAKGELGLGNYVLEFERGLCSGLVAACDVYDDGVFQHVLFFDDDGILLGAQQLSPIYNCLSACLASANEVTSADGGWYVVFAFLAQWPAAADFVCSPACEKAKGRVSTFDI